MKDIPLGSVLAYLEKLVYQVKCPLLLQRGFAHSLEPDLHFDVRVCLLGLADHAEFDVKNCGCFDT